MPPVNGTFCVTVMRDRCINARMASKCASCVEVCPYDVYAIDGTGHVYVQNYNACVGCRICSEFCPEDAIRINPAESEFLVRSPWTFPQVEEIHHSLYTEALKALGAGNDLPAGSIHVCDVCGHTVVGEEPPEKCPICGAPKARFREVA